MLGLNQVKRFISDAKADSTSWGSLVLLAIGVSILLLMMLLFSSGLWPYDGAALDQLP
jgi:hypothetical protein